MDRNKALETLFNSRVSIRNLLMELGYASVQSHTIYCPFHEDRAGGHRSAVIIDRDNRIYCFSCVKSFSAVDVLGLLKKEMKDYLNESQLIEVTEEREEDTTTKQALAEVLS